MNDQKPDTLTVQRIRESTRAKLICLAEEEDRSPVVVLDRLINAALRAHGINTETLKPNQPPRAATTKG
ncbi:hypothetical protein LCGC14_0734020 [marine sediment metagenome]|uniref:Uncharacterized protein n=1 Tax=marine sediment metagenome TaxID=412755 RepID=A0A0F9Q8R9_9ZZZZ